jgi:hypothetical protein
MPSHNGMHRRNNIDTSYLKLIDGARIKSHMGLRLEEGYKYTHGKNYLFIEIPVLGVWVEGEKAGDEAKYINNIKKGQHVFICAAGSLETKGNSFIEVEPNRELAEYGTIQPMYRIHPGDEVTPLGFHFTARRDVDLSQLKYCVRLYMPA